MTPVNLAGVKPEQVPSRRHERPSATAQSSCQHGLFVKPPPAAGLCRRNEKPLDSAPFEWSFAEIKRWQQKLHDGIA
jgi:hypothetical protein